MGRVVGQRAVTDVQHRGQHELLRLAWIFYQLGHLAAYEEVVTALILRFPIRQVETNDNEQATAAPPVLPSGTMGTWATPIHIL